MEWRQKYGQPFFTLVILPPVLPCESASTSRGHRPSTRVCLPLAVCPLPRHLIRPSPSSDPPPFFFSWIPTRSRTPEPLLPAAAHPHPAHSIPTPSAAASYCPGTAGPPPSSPPPSSIHQRSRSAKPHRRRT
jgi:hypothetical protein